jgi:hypothetical protein
MTVPDVADPQAADIDQTRDLVAHRLLNVTQCGDKCHPETLRKSEIVQPNGITQAFDPANNRSMSEHKLPLPDRDCEWRRLAGA